VNLLLGKEILQLQSRGIEKEGSVCKAVLMLSDE
jgi:hypothetical protein